MSDRTEKDASVDATRAAWLARRKAARMVKSRKRSATAGVGGRGAASPGGPDAHMDSLSSENLSPKGATTEQLAPHSDGAIADDCADSLSQESVGVCDKEVPCVVYARPANDRLLLVTFDDKTHGKVVVRPQERVYFGPGKRIWVKWQGRDLYVLAGKYNRFGVRVDSAVATGS